MRSKRFILSAAGSLALALGTTTSWATPALAQNGHHHLGVQPTNLLYVSSAGVAGTPAPAASVVASRQTSSLFPFPAGMQGCKNATYTTIGAAVTAASAGSTIVVCPGVYREDVIVPAGKPLTIEGSGDPLIDAMGQDNGVQVLASGTTIEGLTVGYATGEGILVGTTSPAEGTTGMVDNVVVRDNTVIDNDQGNPTGQVVSGSSYPECNASEGTPGDCGEGIHLLSADNSMVLDNDVYANSGGILITDENGPADGNTIAGNDVSANAYDCGVTLAGHHAGTNTDGTWSPVAADAGGVYNNVVRDNTSSDNGVVGQGAGVLMATGAPGGAVYNNTVEGNNISGNGLAGVTVHSHSPGEDLNGNVVRGNFIGVNDVDGDADFEGNAPPAVDPSTTGVIVAVATGANPISITVEGNWIENDYYGLWVTPDVTATTTPPPNQFVNVNTDIFTAP